MAVGYYSIMKNIFYAFLAIFVLVYFTSCKKPGNLLANSTYDATNNIFRVKASSSNVDYTITITTKNSATGTQINQETGNQSAGDPFEYPFIPAVGDSIKIIAQSYTGTVYLYPLYKGNLLPGVVSQTETNGGSLSTFNYLVTK
jgi:hypothetical protein